MIVELTDTTVEEIDQIMRDAWDAFLVYRDTTFKQRAGLLRAIAIEIEKLGDILIETAEEETHLPQSRLKNERGRTIYQLNSYADACEKASWMDLRIDRADNKRNPPKPDIRKMMVPLGPVVVFGASNFPFAYSTAGGDTACALAAGCPVVVKAHPAHVQTSELVATAIERAIANLSLPRGLFGHVIGGSFEPGKQLVLHKYTKAVAFTGSFNGGKALYELAAQRNEPIPVFAEMGSVNPVFLLPGKLKEDAKSVAKQYAASVTLGTGQFCTNPGLVFAIDNNDLQNFIDEVQKEIVQIEPATMLHPGIFRSYVEKRTIALSQPSVDTIAVAEKLPVGEQAVATVASVPASAFINNPVLHQEVFGPFSLIIRCRDLAEMLEVANSLEGQLTASVMGNQNDLQQNMTLVRQLRNICGRLILNGVPTGVEVTTAMHHGGPFPATSDSRFTSVGSDGIRRFARPIAYQNWPEEFLPDELKDANPLRLSRGEG